MSKIADIINEVTILLADIHKTSKADNDFKVRIVDLIVTITSFSITKWAETSPQDGALGILLLNVQMQCLQYLEDKYLSIPYPIEGKDTQP